LIHASHNVGRARGRPFVWGHRGTRSSAQKPGPRENTLAAMQLALSQGADGIELDVRTCKSGEVVVLHDPDLVRVAGVPLRALDATAEELRAHDVPLLDAAIDLVLGHDRRGRLNVEIKPDVPDVLALTNAVARCLRARTANHQARILVSSFSAEICEAMHAALPDMEIAFLFERAVPELPRGIRAVHPHHKLCDDASIARFHARGLSVNTWTVNDAERARVLGRAAVDAIITDDVPRVLSAFS
jgi:glycerophosphoryl diester phosphodiesterase